MGLGIAALSQVECAPMCDLCKPLKLQIERYKRILGYGFDPLTEERLREAVRELEHRIAELHPET